MPAPAIRWRVRRRERARRARGSAPCWRPSSYPCGAAIATTNAFSPLRTARSSRIDERARAPGRPGATCAASHRAAAGCVGEPRIAAVDALRARRGCRARARAQRRRARARRSRGRSARRSRCPPAQRLGQQQEAAKAERGEQRERDERQDRSCRRSGSPARTGAPPARTTPSRSRTGG